MTIKNICVISHDSYFFRNASARLKNDYDIALLAVSEAGYNLNFVSEDFQNNYNIVLTAVSKNGYALEYASDRLKNDKELLELYINSLSLDIATNSNFYKECELKLQMLKEQEYLEKNIPESDSKHKVKKF